MAAKKTTPSAPKKRKVAVIPVSFPLMEFDIPEATIKDAVVDAIEEVIWENPQIKKILEKQVVAAVKELQIEDIVKEAIIDKIRRSS